MAAQRQLPPPDFEDFLPTMAERLGGEALIEELCAGFRLLADPRLGVITFDSLRRNAALLGLGGMGDDELMGMLREGDLDGDGALDQTDFCVLMFRISPELMEESWRVADEAMAREVLGQPHQHQPPQREACRRQHQQQQSQSQSQRGCRYSR